MAYLRDNVERSIHKNVRVEIGESSFSMGRSWVGCASEMRGDVISSDVNRKRVGWRTRYVRLLSFYKA